jgi:RimJ/RimL family protein N-acetyltransferase
MTSLAGAPVLEIGRLVLRAPEARDREPCASLAATERVRFIGGRWHRAGAWRMFCQVIGTWVARGCGSFVPTRRCEGRAIGLVAPRHPIDWPEPEIGWTIWDPAAEEAGHAREAARAARGHAREILGWETAVSHIDPENVRSVRLAERLGAVRGDAAAHPFGDDPCLVYRHPAPAAPSKEVP